MQLSIIIPTKNEEGNIGRLLKSLSSQSFKKFEVIVVDNHSRDRTLQIAKRFTKKVYLKGPERSVQRNFGLQKAKGKYVLFLDADMQVEKNLLKQSLAALKDKKICGILIDEVSVGKNFLSRVKNLEKKLYRGRSEIESARFFRKKDLVEIGGYDEKLISGEDWDLSQRISKYGDFDRIKSKIYHFENQSVWQDLKKKYYYAKNIGPYARKYPKLWEGKQANFFYRMKILFKKPDLILKNPLEFVGLLALKLLHSLAYYAANSKHSLL